MTEEEKKVTEKELAFIVPTGVEFETDVTGLQSDELIRWHDLMHVFFEKLLDGLGEFGQFKWSFSKVAQKHEEITREMAKRGLLHFTPINNLDNIKVDCPRPVEQSGESSAELSENQAENINISFDAPNKVAKTLE